MANWSINAWPWGGVQLCFDEKETKTVLNAQDAAAAVVAAVGLAGLKIPPVAAAAAIVGAYIGIEKAATQLADKGNGVCFFVPWLAIALGIPYLVIPSPNTGFGVANQQHVNYIGNDGKVHELWYSDSGGWKHNFLNDLSGADEPNFLPAPGSRLDGYATTWNGQQHVNYVGRDGKVHELWYSDGGGWKHNVLNDLAGADQSNFLPAAGCPLDGYATTWNSQQHVNYIGNDGTVHELWYSDSGGWKHNFLNVLAGAEQSDFLPAAGSPLDGYATPWNNRTGSDPCRLINLSPCSQYP
jgi:hypothetical protein